MMRRRGRIEELLGAATAAGLVPGAACRWGGSRESYTTVLAGDAALRPRRPVTRNTWYDLASLTKPLVTTSVFILAIREGRIGPATRVGEVLTEAIGKPCAEVRLTQLLSHTSGLPEWAPLYALAEGDSSKVMPVLLDLPLEAPPGSRVVYSCPGFILLGMILEQVLKQRLDKTFSERVLEPLKLGDLLGFRPNGTLREVAGNALVATAETEMLRDLEMDPAWVPEVGPLLPDDGNARFLDGVAGNAGLFGTVAGVYLLGLQFLPGRGGLFTDEEIALVSRRWTREHEHVRGLGWQLAASQGCSAGPHLASSAFGHTGFTGTSLWIDPRQENVMVLLSNRNHPAHRASDLHPLRRRFHSIVSAT